MAELTLKSPGIEFFETDFAPASAIKLVSPSAIVVNSTWGPVHRLTYCANKRELFKKFGLATSLTCGRYLALAESYLDYSDGIYVVRALPSEEDFAAIAVAPSIGHENQMAITYETSMGGDPTDMIKERPFFFSAKYPGTMGNSLVAAVFSYQGAKEILVDGTDVDAIAGSMLKQIIANLGITENALLNMFGYDQLNQSTWATQKWLLVVCDNGFFPNSFDSYPTFNGILNVREYAFIDPQYQPLAQYTYPPYQSYVNANFTLITAGRGYVTEEGALGEYLPTSGSWEYGKQVFMMRGGSDINDNRDSMVDAIADAYDYLATDTALFETIIAPIYDTHNTSSSASVSLPPKDKNDPNNVGVDKPLRAVAKALNVSIQNRKSVTLFTVPRCSSTDQLRAMAEGLVGSSGKLSEYAKSTYAFADTGWVSYTTKFSTSINGITYTIPMCGMTAGIISYNKINYNIWSAPAGYIRGVYKPGIKLLTPQPKLHRDILYPLSINSIIEDGDKVVLFGNKTFSPDIAGNLSRIEVRLLMLRIQKTVEDYAKTFLFESNDAATRSRFKYLVDQYLSSLKVASGIQDYYIRLDESNNTPALVDTNRLIVSVAVKPQKSINYITINYNIVNSSMSVKEV